MSYRAVPLNRDRNLLPPITELAAALHENHKALMNGRPTIASAAEAVHAGFQGLVDSMLIDKGTEVFLATGNLTIASHAAWLDALVNISQGSLATGLGALRRSLEFTCYAAKMGNDRKKADAWLGQIRDADQQRVFRSSFTIPVAYEPKKYEHVQALIPAYADLSAFGTHANAESLVGLYEGPQEGFATLRYQPPGEMLDMAAVSAIIVGKRMLRAHATTLRPVITDPAKQRRVEQLLAFAHQETTVMRTGYLNHYHQGRVPRGFINGILADDEAADRERFAQMLAEAKQERDRKAAAEQSRLEAAVAARLKELGVETATVGEEDAAVNA